MNDFFASASTTTTFVGRETELAVLSMLLDGALSGHGSIALLSGEPGIGKTRLMQELAVLAASAGARVFWGRCYEGDGAPAFWPWIQVLRAYLESRSPEVVHHELGSQASGLVTLLPELQALIPGLHPPAPVAAAQARFRLFDAVTLSLKAAATATPLVLLLDDLHWADVSSLLLLDFLAHELPAARILVAGSYRDAEQRRGDPLLTTLGNLLRRPHVARVVLGGLSVADVSRCIEAATGTPAPAALATTIAMETGGNPLYLTQMAQLLASQGIPDGTHAVPPPLPSTLRAVIGRGLDRLSDDSHTALTVAAVAGRDFQLAVVAAAGDVEPDAVFDALEEAEAAGVIEQAAGTTGHYRFAHALIRDTLYGDLPTIRRARLHLRVATALEAIHRSNSPAHVAELAAHYRLAVAVTTPDKAVDYTQRAGNLAAATFAWEEAMSQWQAALDLAPSDRLLTRCDLLLSLGDAQNHLGERESAKERFLQAAAAARQLRLDGDASFDDGEDGVHRLVRAALGYGGPGIVLGKLDHHQVSLLEEALDAVGGRQATVVAPRPDGGPSNDDRRTLAAHLLARLALALFWTPRRQESLALSRDAVAMARSTADPRALIAALHVRRYVLWSPEHLEERSGFAGEMVALAETLRDAELTLQGLRWRIVDGLELGETAVVNAAIARYEQLAEEVRHPYFRWYATLFRATLALSRGDYEEGERLARAALAHGERAGDPDAGMFFTMQILPARSQQGRSAEFETAVRGLAERFPTMPAFRTRLLILCLELGYAPEGRQLFDAIAQGTSDPAAGEFATLAHDGNWLVTMANLARACLVLGDQHRAARLYQMLQPFAGRNLVTGAGIASLGPTSYWLGSLAAFLGRTAEATTHFDAALAMATRMEARPQVAITQLAYAGLLLCAEPRLPDAEARALRMLESARATASALGIARLEQDIRQLQAARSRERSDLMRKADTARYPDGLSAREVEVLRLVASGCSNREIASELVLSVVTVQNHVANIYRKADIRNRAEAATYAQRYGLIAASSGS